MFDIIIGNHYKLYAQTIQAHRGSAPQNNNNNNNKPKSFGEPNSRWAGSL